MIPVRLFDLMFLRNFRPAALESEARATKAGSDAEKPSISQLRHARGGSVEIARMAAKW
jgi:hypothetical protein